MPRSDTRPGRARPGTRLAGHAGLTQSPSSDIEWLKHGDGAGDRAGVQPVILMMHPQDSDEMTGQCASQLAAVLGSLLLLTSFIGLGVP